MFPLILTFAALAASCLSHGVSADCNTPSWTPITSNPLQSSSGSITSSPDNQVGSVARFPLFVGLKVMASDKNGDSSMSLSTPSSSTWTVSPGYTGTQLTDFYMYNWNASVTILLYVSSNGQELWMVDQDTDTTTWSNNRQLYSNPAGVQFPQMAYVDNGVWISIQNKNDRSITMLYSVDDLTTITNVGILTLSLSGNPLKPAGQYSMFPGSVDGSSTQELWFFWIDNINSFPLISYATGYANGVQLSAPETVGDIPFYNSTSVTAMVKPDYDQAILLRTGYAESDSPYPYATFTVIKLASGPVNEYCDEDLITWGSSANQVASIWSPALASNPIENSVADVVSVTWVSAVDGTLNALAGTPWS